MSTKKAATGKKKVSKTQTPKVEQKGSSKEAEHPKEQQVEVSKEKVAEQVQVKVAEPVQVKAEATVATETVEVKQSGEASTKQTKKKATTKKQTKKTVTKKTATKKGGATKKGETKKTGKKQVKKEAKKTETKEGTDSENNKTRYFKVIVDGGEAHGRFSGTKPKQAANKALTSILKSKEKVGGSGTTETQGQIKFSIIECTRGSKHKQYNYIGERVKLDNPMKVKIGKGPNIKEIEYRFNNRVMKDKTALMQA